MPFYFVSLLLPILLVSARKNSCAAFNIGLFQDPSSHTGRKCVKCPISGCFIVGERLFFFKKLFLTEIDRYAFAHIFSSAIIYEVGLSFRGRVLEQEAIIFFIKSLFRHVHCKCWRNFFISFDPNDVNF